MRPALLDVNVLIALLDPEHAFHEPAHDWFRRERKHGWATCPITENAVLRILSKPSYPYTGVTTGDVRELLAEFCQIKGHVFWADSISMRDATMLNLTGIGPKGITDVYLLALAVANGGCLVTFDAGIRQESVVGCLEGSLCRLR